MEEKDVFPEKKTIKTFQKLLLCKTFASKKFEYSSARLFRDETEKKKNLKDLDSESEKYFGLSLG